MQPDPCIRCLRRERYQHLLVCEQCASDLVARKAEPAFIPEWRRRLTAKDFSGELRDAA